MKCAIHQPQFMPWLGYLNKIRIADVFVLLDDVQFKKNEFQNRNRIRAGNAAKWITVPVSFSFGDTIREVNIASGRPWKHKLIRTIEHAYCRTAYFPKYASALAELLEGKWDNLAELNQATVSWLMECFEIRTPTRTGSMLTDNGNAPSTTWRLIDICRRVGADTYISGEGGHDYLDFPAFAEAGINLEFQNFLHPHYPQHYTPGNTGFISHLSAIDGLFNCGGGTEGREQLGI